jgi:succinoglycan biosynthesis protein ExoA
MRPTVTVVIAARNEELTIARLLDSLDMQTYDHDRLDVVVADGGSTDRTRSEVAGRSGERRLRTRLIDNPGRVTASGLNAGVDATDADIVIVLGAHAAVPADFVEASVAVLEASGADCAGGVLETVGTTVMGRAIAAATTSPFGVGNALFRTGAATGRDVDTVAFGAYRRSIFRRLGGFDVSLIGAEDDEFNFRVVRSGGRIRFDPSIRATYFCRNSLRGLARQYFMYGRGKAWVLRKHRRAPSARMLAPTALVGVLGATSGAAVVLRRPIVVLVPLVPYLGGIVLGAWRAGLRANASRSRIGAAFVTLHIAYGVGLFAGAMRSSPPQSASESS